MLGLCYPIAQAAFGAVAKPLRHLARHWAGRGVGHGVPHGSIHHAALSHVAGPHAAAPILACARMPGALPAGPLPAASAGPAGSGVVAGPGSGVTGSTYAAGAGSGVGIGSGAVFASSSSGATGNYSSVFGSGGLIGAAAPLAATALIAAGIVTGVMAKPDQSIFPEHSRFQPAIMASVAPHVLLSPTSTVLSPVIASSGVPVMLTAMSQPDMAIPELSEQMAGTPAPSTNASTGAGSTALPEPASLSLLGFSVLGIVAAREWGMVQRRVTAGAELTLPDRVTPP